MPPRGSPPSPTTSPRSPSHYVRDQEHLREITGRLLSGEEEGGFIFLEILLTDFSETTRGYRKGAGAALVQFAREWAERELGMGVMYVDCWAGNEGKLVRWVILWFLEVTDGPRGVKEGG